MKTEPVILSLATKVPLNSLSPNEYIESAVRHLAYSDDEADLLMKITKGTCISKRHSIVSDYSEEKGKGSFFGAEKTPTTKQRNEFYKEEAPKLAEVVCHDALKSWGGNVKDISHIISVSCTGLIAPGLEFILAGKLNLSPYVERLGINFMGCFGAFKGLAIAKALAYENPKHRILVVCTELCSLHFQVDKSKETMVANSLFSDGAAAVIVGCNPKNHERPLMEIHQQKSIALKDSLDFMTWEVGDHGFRMNLSPSIPEGIGRNILSFIHQVISGHATLDECAYAIHPGGKAILEEIAKSCHLENEDMIASWKVLKEYGNMSSPTFLFVLQEILSKAGKKEWVIGMGFGPGLSMEGILLKRVDDNVAK